MTFYERLKELCKENGIEMSNLGKVIGIPLSGATVSRWQNGVMPRNSTLKAIADYFRVDVAYLIGGDSSTANPFEDVDFALSLNAQEAQIIKMFRNASEIGKMRMIQQIVSVWEQDQ